MESVTPGAGDVVMTIGVTALAVGAFVLAWDAVGAWMRRRARRPPQPRPPIWQVLDEGLWLLPPGAPDALARGCGCVPIPETLADGGIDTSLFPLIPLPECPLHGRAVEDALHARVTASPLEQT